MKEFIELIKKLWSNKRYRAVAILLLYVVFFIFVFTFISSIRSQNIALPEKPNETDIRAITEYKYEIIGKENFIVTIKEEATILYNDVIYSLQEKPKELDQYDLSIYTMDHIYQLLKKGTLASTNYIEDSNTYFVRVSDFEQIIYQREIESEEYISITTYHEKIDKIIIDFRGYYDYTVNIELRS